MKNIIIVFAFLLVLIIPSTFAHALGLSNDSIQVQLVVPGLVNGLSDVSDAIKAQTKTLLNTQRQQQIATLDQECVRQITAQVRAKDGSVETQKMIDDFIAKNSTGGDPGAQMSAASHLNYLYSYIDSQNTQLYNVLIKYCPKYVAPTVQQPSQASGIQCNGKAWNVCPTGQKFYCPATGDAQCLIDQPVNTSIKILPPGCPTAEGYSYTTGVPCIENTSSKVLSKNPPVITKIKVESKSSAQSIANKTAKPDEVKVDQKEETIPPANPEPVKKVPWYQRIFSWLW